MRVTDRQIHEVIETLKARDGRVSGAAVRTELARRYGARGGVSRIYRLLGAARGARGLPPWWTGCRAFSASEREGRLFLGRVHLKFGT